MRGADCFMCFCDFLYIEYIYTIEYSIKKQICTGIFQIISTTYLLIFKRMSDEDLYATKYDVGLSPNSICSIMHQFILGCDNLQWESDENLLKSIQMNVASMLKEGEV